MNYIWCVMIICSFVCAAFTGRINETAAAMAEGALSAAEAVFSFAGIMCFWCGIMRIMEGAGVMNAFERLIRPLTERLFPGADTSAKKYITLNLTANLLGLGNAATPAGMQAMEALDKTNSNPKKPSYEMCMLLVLNTTSFQLVPTTIMSLRSAAGGEAASVILPIWITSAVSVVLAALSVRLFYGRGGGR